MVEEEQRSPQSDDSTLHSISLISKEDRENAPPAPHFEVVATEDACSDIMQQARYVSIGWQPGRRPEWSATLLDAAGHMLPDKYRVYQVDEREMSPAKAFDAYLLDATLSAFALAPEEIGAIEQFSFNRAAEATQERFANEINERARTIEESLAAQIQRYIDEDPVIQETLDVVAETNRILAEVNASLGTAFTFAEIEALLAQITAAYDVHGATSERIDLKEIWDGVSTTRTTQASSTLTVADLEALFDSLRDSEFSPGYMVMSPYAAAHWPEWERKARAEWRREFQKRQSLERRQHKLRLRIRRKRRAIARRRRKGMA